MYKSNRSFTITKLKNDVKIIDSFITHSEERLIVLTSIGRIFKFDLSNRFIPPTSRQSQGIVLIKLLPTEKIVSCCNYKEEENIYLISKKGKFFKIKSDQIYNSNEFKLGYINEMTAIKNDNFLKIISNCQYLDIETNKNKSARLNFNKLTNKSSKTSFKIDFLELDKDEYIENCSRLENLLN